MPQAYDHPTLFACRGDKRPEQAFGSCGLVGRHPDQEAELLQLLQARAGVRVQVILVEMLGETGLFTAEPLDR
jgi:hypothetical protein